MKIERYVKTLADAAGTPAADTAITQLMAHLGRTGRTKLLPRILRELRQVIARRDAEAPRVEVAQASEGAAALAAASALGVQADTVQVNPLLVRGWRARSGTTLVDRSAHRALVELYQNIIA